MTDPAPRRLHAILHAVPPFDFPLCRAYLARSPLEALDRVEDGAWRRAVALNGRPALLTVRSLGTHFESTISLEVAGPEVGPAELNAAEHLVRRALRLDLNPHAFEVVAGRDPVLADLVRRTRGLRPLLMLSPFEALVWAILGQQISVGLAYRLKRALVERLGPKLTVDGATYHLFPSPERLAATAVDDLQALQFTRQKAVAVQEAAERVARHELDLQRLADLPLEEAIERLMALRGVGRWTAEYVCMRGLGFLDVIPAADLGLRAVVGRWYALGRPAEEAELRALAERWRPYRSWAAFLWWYAIAPGVS